MEYKEEISLAGLNKSQRKFCKAPITKNIRLLAPAGSGKTYSLLWRCKYIMSERQRKEQVEPYFLIVAFFCVPLLNVIASSLTDDKSPTIFA